MSSSADSAARPLPRLARIWDGQVEPLNTRAAGADETDLTFLAVPENAAAELAPPLRRAGRSRDRSVRRVPDQGRCGAVAVVSGDEVTAGRAPRTA